VVPSDYPLPGARAAFADLRRALDQYRSVKKARYGIYIEDLHSGLTIDLDGRLPYTAAVAMTFPVALYAFARGASGALDLDAQVEYLPEDRAGGSGVIQAAPFGSRYTYRQLCYHALVDSDNVAWRMLNRTLGDGAVKQWLRSIGGQHAEPGSNQASPADFATYFKYLLDFADRQPGLGGTLLGWLKKSGNPDWAPRSLPRAVVMAHKTGLWPTALTDVGIVFLPREPYLLCIMSDLTRELSLGQAVDDLAKMGAIAFQTMRPLAGTFAGVYLNGERLTMDLPAALAGGQVMAPLAPLAGALGARLTPDGCTLTKCDTTVTIAPDCTTIQVCGETCSLPRAPFQFEGQLIVPLRAVAEALGARTDWDAERYRLLLTL
jgi:beta-lactamase class A